ncbi:hypothetical protein TcG_10877, partial [Trypanosoma cruzi]
MPSWHDLSRRTASMPGTWNSSPQSGGRTERNSRRKRKARTPRDRRFSVWRNSVPGVDPDIVPEWRYRAKARCNSCPLFDRPARALRITKNPLCRWCRPFLYRGDRPASASAGTSSRQKLRNFLSTSERRIDILLLNLRQGAPVCPQRDGTCPTCSAWRSDGLRGLTCGCRDYFMVFLTGASRAGRHRRSKHASRQGTQG